METPASILVIDDEPVVRDVLERLLVREGYEVTAAEDSDRGLSLLREHRYDVILLDLMLPGRSGLEVVREIHSQDPESIVIMLTAFASIQAAVRATKAGVFDFLIKPFKNDELLVVVKNGLERRRLAVENRQLRDSLRETYSIEKMVGKSEAMQKIFALVHQIAPQRTTVLINGESGTGKELVARAVHNLSPRSDGPFVALNAGAIPTGLMESELFGHTRGAFTGAIQDKRGLFEAAHGGTLFLDEVGTLGMDMQAKLLRAIQTRQIRPVGGVNARSCDVRILAATNTDLRMACEAGEFRQDLYYRLNVIRVDLPPLRERREDIPLLVSHFLERSVLEGGAPHPMTSEVLKALVDYSWPGNVRELENIVELAVTIASPGAPITLQHLPTEILEPVQVSFHPETLLQDDASLKEMVSQFERNLITTALERNDWNQRRTAQVLRMIPTTLNQKIKRLNIKTP